MRIDTKGILVLNYEPVKQLRRRPPKWGSVFCGPQNTRAVGDDTTRQEVVPAGEKTGWARYWWNRQCGGYPNLQYGTRPVLFPRPVFFRRGSIKSRTEGRPILGLVFRVALRVLC
jgi:hypothetical protein